MRVLSRIPSHEHGRVDDRVVAAPCMCWAWDAPRHPLNATIAGYRYWGCRCNACTPANRKVARQQRDARRGPAPEGATVMRRYRYRVDAMPAVRTAPIRVFDGCRLIHNAALLGLILLGLASAERAHRRGEWAVHDFFVVAAPGCGEEARASLDWLPDPSRAVLTAQGRGHRLRCRVRRRSRPGVRACRTSRAARRLSGRGAGSGRRCGSNHRIVDCDSAEHRRSARLV